MLFPQLFFFTPGLARHTIMNSAFAFAGAAVLIFPFRGKFLIASVITYKMQLITLRGALTLMIFAVPRLVPLAIVTALLTPLTFARLNKK
jgi:hypothetical protein